MLRGSFVVSSIALAAILGASCTFDFEEPFAAGAAGVGAGGGTPVPEVCTNGADDDLDGLLDCADSECEAFVCVEAAPEGWQGPVIVVRDDTDPPACRDASAPALSAGVGLVARDHSCTACECGIAEGGTCVSPLTVWDSNVCTASVEATLDVQNLCATFTTSDTQSTVSAPTAVIGRPGACAATGGELTKDEATFTEHVTLCGAGASVGICDAEQACTPSPVDGEQLCIYVEDDAECPSTGAYTQRKLGFQSLADERACVPCACSEPQDTVCGASTLLYNDATCMNLTQFLPHDGSCTSLSSATTFWYMTQVFGPGGACVASGGDETGQAELGGPITICCAQ